MFRKAFSFLWPYLAAIMSDKERMCTCAMNRIFGYEPEIAHRIIDHLGSASALFELREDELRGLFGPFSRFNGRISPIEIEKSMREIEYMSSLGARFITIADPGYPRLLRECSDAPVGIYVMGSSADNDIFNARPCIAIVGTRGLTSYGREWCRQIIAAMSRAKIKPCIVSGMAIGTDICAHEAALETGLSSIGVMPSGLDQIYPSRHRGFASRLASTPGCALISDYPPETDAAKVNFVRRNRIIAGMCSATILVESRTDGGGMITARLASSYGRDLFCLPGRIDDICSQGCNQLIHEKMAEPIAELGSLVEALGLGTSSRRKSSDLRAELEEHYGNESPMVRLGLEIKKHRDTDIPSLASTLGMPYLEVSKMCSMLEADGFINIDLLQRCSINVKIV